MIDLPFDIICEICTYCSLKDISQLKLVSKVSNNCVAELQNHIIIQNMKIFDKCNYFKYHNDLCYDSIQYYLTDYFYKYKRIFDIDFWNVKMIDKCNFLKHYILNFEKYHHYPTHFIRNITNSKMINSIFNKVFKFYVNNNYIYIKAYPNRLELFVLYIFLQIEVQKNISNLDYTLDFLESSTNTISIKQRYYNHILSNLHLDNYLITFDQFYKMSCSVISISVFKKIFGYKVLDLSNSILNLCCHACNEEALYGICNLKINLPNDDLLSHNYTEFKSLLKVQNIYYYTILLNYETRLINDMIYIKNPITNRRVRINGSIFRRLMTHLEKNMFVYYKEIDNFITKRQSYLRNRLFN